MYCLQHVVSVPGVIKRLIKLQWPFPHICEVMWRNLWGTTGWLHDIFINHFDSMPLVIASNWNFVLIHNAKYLDYNCCFITIFFNPTMRPLIFVSVQKKINSHFELIFILVCHCLLFLQKLCDLHNSWCPITSMYICISEKHSYICKPFNCTDDEECGCISPNKGSHKCILNVFGAFGSWS